MQSCKPQPPASVLPALVSERGWSGTGMCDVASAAGVSVETVYAHFRSMPELLQAALDVAVRGDDEPIPLAERPSFAASGAGHVSSERGRPLG